MARLDGKVAIITGGARGMGAEESRRLVADGARVVIGDILEDEGKALADEIGEAAIFVHLDVASEESWAEAVEMVAAAHVHTIKEHGPDRIGRASCRERVYDDV